MFKSLSLVAAGVLLLFCSSVSSAQIAGQQDTEKKFDEVTRVYYVADLIQNNTQVIPRKPARHGGGGVFSVPSKTAKSKPPQQIGGFGGGGGAFGGGGGQVQVRSKQVTLVPPRYDALIDLIQIAVEPQSWEEGDTPSITPWNGALVIRAQERVHQKVKTFLGDLRTQLGKVKPVQVHWVAVLADANEQKRIKALKGVDLENSIDQLTVCSGLLSVSHGTTASSTAGEFRNIVVSVNPVVGGGTQDRQNNVGYQPVSNLHLFGWKVNASAARAEDGSKAVIKFGARYTQGPKEQKNFAINSDVRVDRLDSKTLEVEGQVSSIAGKWNCCGSIEAGSFFPQADQKDNTKRKLMIFVKWE